MKHFPEFIYTRGKMNWNCKYLALSLTPNMSFCHFCRTALVDKLVHRRGLNAKNISWNGISEICIYEIIASPVKMRFLCFYIQMTRVTATSRAGHLGSIDWSHFFFFFFCCMGGGGVMGWDSIPDRKPLVSFKLLGRALGFFLGCSSFQGKGCKCTVQ